jgi:hypothetical protein
MPFCPECKTEYVAGAKRCSDCHVDLVDQLPVEISVELEECENCEEEVEAGSDYCPQCGVLRLVDRVACRLHPERDAESVCIICSAPLCPECRMVKEKRSFCLEHKNVEVSENWALAFQSTDYYEANLVRGKLENAGITVSPRNNNGIGFIADGFIETAIGRTILKYPVKVFVPIQQYLEAFEIVKEEAPPLGPEED